jgi:hypothetical protein
MRDCAAVSVVSGERAGGTPQLAAVDLLYELPVRAGETAAPRIVGLPIAFDRVRPLAAFGPQARRAHG